jgi:hypothetical protein
VKMRLPLLPARPRVGNEGCRGAKELHAMRIELLAVCQKYGVPFWEGMNELIIEDQKP